MSEKLTNTERVHHNTIDTLDTETFLAFYSENEDKCNAEGYVTDYDLMMEQEYTDRLEDIVEYYISLEE